ncbi:hypothetical protein BASA81_007918 [Batrachochytrium salamandrivorans]|nr:hypothetical protein BASA81_007918 [Batrachochytrium salamandrivorans]
MLNVLEVCELLPEATNKQKRTLLCRLDIVLLGERDVGAKFWFVSLMDALMECCLGTAAVDVKIQGLMILLALAKQPTNRRCLVHDYVGLVDVLVDKAVIGENKEVKGVCLLVLSQLLKHPDNLHELHAHRGLLEVLMYSARNGDGVVVQLWSLGCLELLSRGKRNATDSIALRYSPHTGETEFEICPKNNSLVSFWVHVNGVIAIRSAHTSACAIRRLPKDLCRLVFQVLET